MKKLMAVVDENYRLVMLLAMLVEILLLSTLTFVEVFRK